MGYQDDEIRKLKFQEIKCITIVERKVIAVYLINGWLKWGVIPVLIFTGVFVVGYFVILAIIITVTKRRTARLNEILKQKHQREDVDERNQ